MAGFANKVNVTICGGGNGAHVFAGVSSLVTNAHVTVLDIYENEAERWTSAMAENGFSVNFKNGQRVSQLQGDVKFTVTRDAESVIPTSDIVVIVVPAYTHEIYMNLIAPLLPNNCPVVGMPGQPGFEYQALSILREHGKNTSSIMSVETLPWACRISKYGTEVGVMGTKDEVCYTLVEQTKEKTETVGLDPVQSLQTLLGSKPVLIRVDNILKYTFLCRPTLHPPIMYAKWRIWDGTPLDKPPLFYQGVDEDADKYLSGITDEMINVANALQIRFPDIDFTKVSSMQQWLIDHYSDQIPKQETLLSCLQTNTAYDGLLHPMTRTADGKYVPDFNYRYIREDVPYGLLVIRQIADMVGVKTRVIDEIIEWAQTKLGKEYIRNGILCSVDRADGRLPSAYGINTIEEFINFFD